MNNNNIDREKISLSFFIEGLKSWILYLISRARFILFGTITIVYLTISFNYITHPVYYARTTFVLDNNKSPGSIAELSSIASLAGINPSNFIEAGSFYLINNDIVYVFIYERNKY